MNIIIRQEQEEDYKITEYVVEEAFKVAEYADHTEQFLVAKLRNSDAFVPELSLVAECNGEIIGHIMLTKILIRNDEREEESLSLAPLSVLPEYQNEGVGSKLIEEALKTARNLGFKSVIVLGHNLYYPKFGFKPAKTWGITSPFDVRDEFFMALELQEGSLKDASGLVIYPREFWE